jgi:hypothetical protein
VPHPSVDRSLTAIRFIAFSGWLGLLAAAGAWAQPLQPVPALVTPVIDTTGTLQAPQKAALEAKLSALEAAKGSQVVLLMVPTTAPEDIASYANRIGNAWKIGRKGVGDGVLLVVAKDDRKVRIEVAKTLEGAIPDLAAKQIIDEALTPRFKQGDYAGGLDAGHLSVRGPAAGRRLRQADIRTRAGLAADGRGRWCGRAAGDVQRGDGRRGGPAGPAVHAAGCASNWRARRRRLGWRRGWLERWRRQQRRRLQLRGWR